MRIKLCGLRESWLVLPSIDYLGINLIPSSSRYLSNFFLDDEIHELIAEYKAKADIVAVVQNADQVLYKKLLDYDIDGIQFHGDEQPQDIIQIKNIFQQQGKSLQILKALSYDQWQDYTQYESVVDLFVFDAKVPWQGRSYDYRLLQEVPDHVPFLVAWWVWPDNLEFLIKTLPHATGIDMASSIEATNQQGKTVRDQQVINNIISLIQNI